MATIDTANFTEEQQALFIQGWKWAGGRMDDFDMPAPWCAPWHWGDTEIEVEGDDVEAWGAQHWHRHKAEIERLLAEEAELKRQLAEDDNA